MNENEKKVIWSQEFKVKVTYGDMMPIECVKAMVSSIIGSNYHEEKKK